MKTFTKTLAAALCLAGSFAAIPAHADVLRNGIVLNGIVLNGFVLNGIIINGIIINGTSTTGIEAGKAIAVTLPPVEAGL